MQISQARWKRASGGLVGVLIVVLGLMLWGHLLTSGPTSAQGNQPPDTQELFASFWEAWDLLHDNYVDSLDDNALIQGAMEGLLRAAQDVSASISLPPLVEAPENTNELFAPFWELWTAIHETYPDVDDNALLDGALWGLMAAVGDPHTDYMDPETYANVMEGMSGEYEGIGATVRQNEEFGGLELVSIIEGSPAEEAGLRSGDVIVQVEGQDVTPLSQNEIIAMVRGPAGTAVRLGIRRPGVEGILTFEVVRQRINVPSVSSRMLEENIGYIRLSSFEDHTAFEMIETLETMNANDLSGLILDVRGNPGGYLNTSIQVASAYLPEGNVLIERTPDRTTEYPRVGDVIAPDVPMVVLVDQGSASASELIAGALQDHERATILGTPTFGKGSVQRWYGLPNGGGIRITVSRWFTPSGRSVSESGIHPDIIVPYQPDETNGDDNQLAAAIQVLQGTYVAEQTAPEERVTQ